ncbi:MAG: four helix bundle protein [Candidatus Hydrothermarchaeales archaeon]
MLRTYRDLKVWEKSYNLCLEVYKLLKKLPVEERYGLSLQMRRSVVSIPSNIAEGYGRRGKQEYIHYLYVAYGSYCELETQLLLASDLGYIEKETFEKIFEQAREVERMLKALIDSLDKKSSKP